ncbi:unnamed protein product [Alopecurus aequalis]
MEESYRQVSEGVSTSVVTVLSRGLFCIGSVVQSTADTKWILTSSSFIRTNNRIDVRFYDDTIVEVKRLVELEGAMFTLLVVDSTVVCSVLEFCEKDVDVVSEAVVLAPTSGSSFSHIPSFVIQPSCAARDHKMVDIQESEQYFLVSCHYGGLEICGHHFMLVSAPVFDLRCKAIGLVTSQCGEKKNKVVVKIGLSASNARKSVLDLLEKSKQQEKVAQSPEEKKEQDRVAETESSVGARKGKKRLRKGGLQIR